MTQTNSGCCGNTYKPCRCSACARAVVGAAELIILSECAEARAEGFQKMATEKCRIVPDMN